MAMDSNGKPSIGFSHDHDGSNQGIYEDEPDERRLMDLIALYFRCRCSDRPNFLANLQNDQQRAQINKEVERIAQLRATFKDSDPNNRSLLNDLERHKSTWKQEARASSQHQSMEISKELNLLRQLHDNIQHMEEKNRAFEEIKRFEDELRILEEVKKWSNGPAPRGSQGHQRQHSLTTINPTDRTYDEKIPRITLRQTVVSTKPGEENYNKSETMKFPISQALYDQAHSPLTKPADPNTLRYFHIPSNNMRFVEEAIGRYYNEEIGEYDDRSSIKYRKRASGVLNHQYWKGQQYGTMYDPISARHMRPRCLTLRANAELTPGSNHTNLAMFMPYLHWEFASRRGRMAQVAEEIWKEKRTGGPMRKPTLEVRQTLEGFRRRWTSRGQSISIAQPLKLQRSALAEYLLLAAKVAEAMQCYHNEQQLRACLLQESPLHMRRTLDQSYYLKIKDNVDRDRDQVVYRATDGRRSQSKRSRVVMVDQLWLWILDENTIITSFPKRWGRNKPDTSGVHRNIRNRITQIQDGEVRSIYDLALIIVDQCSRVFFDRNRPLDERPEVLDMFADAVGHVYELNNIVFDRFRVLLQDNKYEWDNLEAIRRMCSSVPEAEIFQESMNIIMELAMMINIYDQQLTVMKEFKRALESINERKNPEKGNLVQEIRTLRSQINSQPSDNDARFPGATQQLATIKLVPQATLSRTNELIDKITERRGELLHLENAAKKLSDQIDILMALKQQQATRIEAQASLKLSEESIRQGRSIMLFTVMTIIFLPIGVVSSIFGMNNKDFGSGTMKLKHQFGLTFGVSIVVIVISFTLAFSSWIRALMQLSVTILWARIIEYSGLRNAWSKRAGKTAELKQRERDQLSRIRGSRERNEFERDLEKARIIEMKTNPPRYSKVLIEKYFGKDGMHVNPNFRSHGR